MNAATICINAACAIITDLSTDTDYTFPVGMRNHHVQAAMVGAEIVGQLLSEMGATHQMRWQCIKFLCKQWGWCRADAITACYFKGC